MMNRKNIENVLLENAENISSTHEQEIKSWDGLVLSKDNLFIPGYIPYIGGNYLNVESNIITYALSQNLHPSDEFVVRYAENWKERQNIDMTLNRQNLSFNSSGLVQMHPFDTGHLPTLSGILTYLVSKNDNINPIYDISATNLSKFSFRNSENRAFDNQKSLNKCFWWFTKQELEFLNPDYIICAGDSVYNIINRNITKLNIKAKPLLVKFPSLLVINGFKKPLTNNDKNKLELIISIFSSDFLNKESSYKNKKKLIDIIKRDAFYFVRMYESIKNQINSYVI